MNKVDWKTKANEIMEMAQKSGAETDFFFTTTFKRYQVQLEILEKLEQAIRDDGTLVEKEYVKGRKNVYSHPAVSEYNKTCTSANQTVQTLLKIITTLNETGLTERTDSDEAL